MFEKEAKEYAEKKICQEYTDGCMGFYKCKEDCERYHNTQKYWQDGAEFGYNKANEWHYPSKAEYPPLGTDVLIYIKLLNNDKAVKIGSFQQGGGVLIEGFICSTGAVIAWQSLSNLPTEGEYE